MSDSMHVVIMAGGSGTRFWPRGRRTLPKQFLDVLGDSSLFERTLDRIPDSTLPEHVLVLTNEAHRELVTQQSGLPATSFIFEPAMRDTAACLALAAAVIHRGEPTAVMTVLAADHLIEPKSAFVECLATASQVAQSGGLVTIGIRPSRAATGYGYVELGDKGGDGAFRVLSFREKPDQAQADEYLKTDNYLWNSGIFAWRVDVLLDEVRRQMPELHEGVLAIANAGDVGSPTFEAALSERYESLPRTSIDYGILEGAEHVSCVRAAFEWDDVGSFDAVARHCAQDGDGNAREGDVVFADSTNCFVDNRADGVVATLGVSDLVIVRTGDAVLVAKKGELERVKSIVARLEADGHAERL